MGHRLADRLLDSLQGVLDLLATASAQAEPGFQDPVAPCVAAGKPVQLRHHGVVIDDFAYGSQRSGIERGIEQDPHRIGQQIPGRLQYREDDQARPVCPAACRANARLSQ
jgi:hypothetical protein